MLPYRESLPEISYLNNQYLHSSFIKDSNYYSIHMYKAPGSNKRAIAKFGKKREDGTFPLQKEANILIELTPKNDQLHIPNLYHVEVMRDPPFIVQEYIDFGVEEYI